MQNGKIEGELIVRAIQDRRASGELGSIIKGRNKVKKAAKIVYILSNFDIWK